jgi:hypothetical protein
LVLLKITHRKAEEVPTPSGTSGRVNQVLAEIMQELTKLAPGMVMVIETGDETTIRATKALITRAGNELGMPVRHWHAGTEVYAKPVEAAPSRKQRSERANRGDYRD